jgi:hypothetical protein
MLSTAMLLGEDRNSPRRRICHKDRGSVLVNLEDDPKTRRDQRSRPACVTFQEMSPGSVGKRTAAALPYDTTGKLIRGSAAFKSVWVARYPARLERRLNLSEGESASVSDRSRCKGRKQYRYQREMACPYAMKPSTRG